MHNKKKESGDGMPACAAHYQFGQDVLKHLDEKLRVAALENKKEYDIGLQGPDIFFFYKPYSKTPIADYGMERHNQLAIRMFAPILKAAHDGAALAYLMGLICHYALDKSCHPYVYSHSNNSLEHQCMESEFDRYIMMQYGLDKPRYQYVPFWKLNFKAMAELWPGMEVKIIKKCVLAQRNYTRLLDHSKFVNICELAANKPGEFTSLSLPHGVEGKPEDHVQQLIILYKKALSECPVMINLASVYMGSEIKRGLGFDFNYLGGTADKQENS